MIHTYPPHRAGYFGNEPINLPLFPIVLYSATCPRCLTTIIGPASGICVKTEGEGDKAIERILDNHACVLVAVPPGSGMAA